MFSPEKLGWYEAAEYCASLGGHLVTINSQEENDFLTRVFTRPRNEAVMIGASDFETEGDWKWVTGEAFSYSNWREGEPNNEYEEDYAMLIADGFWNDGHLDRENWYFICEWEGAGGYVLTYKGNEYLSAEYNASEDNRKWKTEYDLTAQTGEFDWGQALISFVEGGYNDSDAYKDYRKDNLETQAKYGPSTPHGKVTTGIAKGRLNETGLDKADAIFSGLQMIAGFAMGGMSGYQNFHILLQTDGINRRFLILYGRPFELAYAGLKKIPLSNILMDKNAGNAAYVLHANEDADRSIRESFGILNEGGRYIMELSFASFKDMEDCFYGYSVFINSDGQVFESPIFHRNTIIDVYYRPEGEKKAQLEFHAAPMMDNLRYLLDDVTTAFLINYLEGLE